MMALALGSFHRSEPSNSCVMFTPLPGLTWWSSLQTRPPVTPKLKLLIGLLGDWDCGKEKGTTGRPSSEHPTSPALAGPAPSTTGRRGAPGNPLYRTCGRRATGASERGSSAALSLLKTADSEFQVNVCTSSPELWQNAAPRQM